MNKRLSDRHTSLIPYKLRRNVVSRKNSDTLAWLVQDNGRTESTQSGNTDYVVPVDRDSFVPGEATSSTTSTVDVSNAPRLSHPVNSQSVTMVLSQVHGRTYPSASDCVLFLAPCQLHVISSVQQWQRARLNDTFES